jgi:hypothetical protein
LNALPCESIAVGRAQAIEKYQGGLLSNSISTNQTNIGSLLAALYFHFNSFSSGEIINYRFHLFKKEIIQLLL